MFTYTQIVLLSIPILLPLLALAVEEETIAVAEEDEKYAKDDIFGRKSMSVDKLKNVLKLVDKNQDGLVTRDELIEWNVETSLKDLKRRVDIDFEANDYDKNKLLSWGEMLYPVFGYTDETIDKLLKSKDPQDKHAIEFLQTEQLKFIAADMDDDGLLTPEEYTAMLNPYQYPKMLKYTTDKIMVNDKDNDSHLSPDEFKQYYYLTDEELNDYQQNEFKLTFKNFDMDKNGLLSRQELEIWYAPDIRVAAEIDADELMDKSDKDGDGKLTKDEVVAAKRHWEDSRATDFGQHMRDEL